VKLKVKGLRAKPYPGGIRYYWEPSPAERRAKWQGISLGSDLAAAVTAAEKRNAEIEEWRTGGARPRAVAAYVKRNTVAAGIKRYRAEVLAHHAASTRRTAETPLKRLETWAGDMPISWVTRARVKALRDAMMKPEDQGGIGHHPAFHVLERGRAVWKFLVDEDLAPANPFVEFGLGKPPARQVYWEDHHRAAIDAAAAALQRPSIALAVALGLYIGQREADILALPLTAWRPIPRAKFRADPALYDQLASSDGPHAGQVMGIYVRQGKTKRWVGIPVEGEDRRRIEAAIAEAKATTMRSSSGAIAQKAPRTTIIGRDSDGQPWQQDNFIEVFGKVRQHAADQARTAGDAALAAELEALWYGDLRRSCVVFLGELGLDDAAIGAITGHKLNTIKTILETYMPRTEGMAARAIAARAEAQGRPAGNVVQLQQDRS